VEPTRDKKLREQLRSAALSVTEAGKAIKTGHRKPRKHRCRRVLVVIGVGAVGAAAALAASEELRSTVLVMAPSLSSKATRRGRRSSRRAKCGPRRREATIPAAEVAP
jgi:hypothetical protein